MSTYFYIYQALQATQYQVVSILAVVGLVWGGCWLLWDRVEPSRWRTVAQWVYMLLAAVLGAYTLISIGS